jgi:hypothetical protein
MIPLMVVLRCPQRCPLHPDTVSLRQPQGFRGGWLRHIPHSSAPIYRWTGNLEFPQLCPAVCVPKIRSISAGNADGKPARFRRVPGSTELLNDLAPVAGSRPRSFDSILSPYFVDSHDKLIDNWFRQIIPLSMWHTLLSGINFIPIL